MPLRSEPGPPPPRPFRMLDPILDRDPPRAGDQAEGLRRLFGAARPRFVPVVSNPHVAFGGVLLERLCTAWGERGCSTLVVDAGERAGEPGEMAAIDLAQCIEVLQPQAPRVSYLAARGLPLRHVDATGRSTGLLRAIADAAPQTDAVFVHAPASDLARCFPVTPAELADVGAEVPSPIVLASDHPQSVTHAYAAMKWLAHRGGHRVFDLVIAAAPRSPRATAIAAKIATCAELYFGGVVRRSVRIDPASDAGEPPSTELRRMAAERVGAMHPPRTLPSEVPAAALRPSHFHRPTGHAHP